MRLRTLLTTSAILLAVLGISAAATLIATTSLLRLGTDQLAQAIESIRAAEELEISLLIHDRERRLLEVTSRAQHARGMARAAQSIADGLDAVEDHVTGESERLLVQETRTRVNAYLKTIVPPPEDDAETRRQRLNEALISAQRLINLNVAQARAFQDEAERVDNLANGVGITLSLILLSGIAAVLLAMRSQLYRPLLGLRQALARFTAGHKDSRAPERGPEEFQEIAAEFNAMAETLARQEKTQLQFLAGVAHDLRNPLNALKLTATGLTRGPSLPPEDKIRQTLARITGQVDRLNRMVEDLLDQTRIEAGNLELRLEESDLRELASEVVELHRPTSSRHHIELVLPAEPVRVRCDPVRIEQVLTNLLSNAVKYSPEGGTVRVTLAQDQGQALLTVSDEGIGIAEQDRQRIFEPFKRSSSARGGIPGVGLGLSVARRIILAHRGTLEVESAVGEGSTFRVRLPWSPEETLREPARAQDASGAGNSGAGVEG